MSGGSERDLTCDVSSPVCLLGTMMALKGLGDTTYIFFFCGWSASWPQPDLSGICLGRGSGPSAYFRVCQTPTGVVWAMYGVFSYAVSERAL